MSDRIRAGYINSIAIVRSTKHFLLHEAGAETSDGQSDPIIVGDYSEGLLLLKATATAGSSISTAFKLQTKIGEEWVDHSATIAAVTAAAIQCVPVTNFGDEIRLRWDLNGTTTSVTFSAEFIGKT